jgi:hypothetical protein
VRGAGVLGEAALADAEHLVAALQAGHVLADRLDAPGDLPASHAVLGRTDPEAREAQRVGHGHEMPDAPVHAGCEHAQQHLVGSDLGPVDLLEPQDVLGFAVLILDDRRHRRHLGRHGSGFRRFAALLGSHHYPLTL